MHRPISKNLEGYLRGSVSEIPAEFALHLEACEQCASELHQLEAHSQLLQSLKAKEMEPRAGFYARVMERIEAQQSFSIWSIFLDRKFGFRLAVASGVLAVLLGGYLVTTEPSGPETGFSTASAPGVSSIEPDGQQQRDAVLADLASYRQ